MRCRVTLIALVVAATLARGSDVAAVSPMDTIVFPVTVTSPVARAAFERGMVALHSFAYSDALESFRAAIVVEPNFVMAHWGEAMAFNRPVWNEQDTASGRAAVARLDALRPPRGLTGREQALVEAVRQLYRGDDKRTRDRAHLAAMERLYAGAPEDDEIACFTALAAMGAGRTEAAAGGNDLGLRMRAAALALDVFRRSPNHPGAAHYAIHALDDPEHAILALPAARHYAHTAPDAYHALHMPSHIFVHLGMWADARVANEKAWASSVAWAARKAPPSSQRDTHSLSWLGFVQLQEGRKAAALATLAALRETAAVRPVLDVRQLYYAQLAGSFLVESGDWSEAAALFAPLAEAVPAPKSAPEPSSAELPPCCHPGATAHADTAPAPAYLFSAAVARAYFRGLGALRTGKRGEALLWLGELQQLAVRNDVADSDALRTAVVHHKQLAALVEAGDAARSPPDARALPLLNEAATIEAQIPISGPLFAIPSRELAGELLLAAHKPVEARAAFNAALERYPNRPRSLLGLARATRQAGDKVGARETCRRLATIWNHADAEWPDGAEIRACAK
jgi:tetratricopeptide (TPR) repeat protein